VKDLLIGILSPVVVIIACCGVSVVVLRIASAGNELAQMQRQDHARHLADRHQAETLARLFPRSRAAMR
jgi:hypothetical protein